MMESVRVLTPLTPTLHTLPYDSATVFGYFVETPCILAEVA